MGEPSNLDTIEAGYRAFNEADWEAVPAFFHDDAVLDASVSFVGPVSYEGRDGVARFLDSIADRFEHFACDVREMVDAGEHVLCVVRLHGRAALTGRPVEAWEVHVWSLRDGGISALRVFLDRAEAERAVGLRPA